MSRYVVFLGAGASAAAGLPLQRHLLSRFFSQAERVREGAVFTRGPARFFHAVFRIDVSTNEHLDRLPSFEDTLGIVDLAIQRGEPLRGFPIRADALGEPSLTTLRRDLVLIMADAVRSAAATSRVHGQLVRKLLTGGKLRQTAFITTNYDTLLDLALEDVAAAGGDFGVGPAVDYGFCDLTLAQSAAPEDEARSTVLKLHGSLNWLYCPTCSDLVVTHGPDIVARLLDNPQRAACERCETVREPVIVPPTIYKDLSNVYLAMVRAHAARVLRDASHLVFCGYSMPDADMHVKLLVKAAQMNRQDNTSSLQVTLVNGPSTTARTDRSLELARYYDLLGVDAVTDSGLSFEEFAGDPGAVLGRPRG